MKGSALTPQEEAAARRITTEARRCISPALRQVGGRALYSPASTLVSGSRFYVLGINPREAPDSAHLHSFITVEADLERLAKGEIIEHAYLDEQWKGHARGQAPIQLRGQQVFSILAGGSDERGLALLRATPVSNFILQRSNDVADLERKAGTQAWRLALAYWPFHQAVIQETQCTVVLTHAVVLARQFARGLSLGEGEQRPSGWGGSLSTCYAWELPDGPMMLAIPNLSRYIPDGPREVALAKFFKEFAPSG